MIAIDVLKMAWCQPGVHRVSSWRPGLSLAVDSVRKASSPGQAGVWGEAMIGSTYAFGVLFLTYGILPHQWIDHADKNLGWSKDKL